MEEEVILYKNDTVRAIEKIIVSVNNWKEANVSANPRETALVLTKLEEARFWAYVMVKREQ